MSYHNGFWDKDDFVTADQIKKTLEESKMEEVQKDVKKGRYPDFKGADGSAAWLNDGAKGQYLSVVLADKTRLTLFKSEPGVQEVKS